MDSIEPRAPSALPTSKERRSNHTNRLSVAIIACFSVIACFLGGRACHWNPSISAACVRSPRVLKRGSMDFIGSAL